MEVFKISRKTEIHQNLQVLWEKLFFVSLPPVAKTILEEKHSLSELMIPIWQQNSGSLNLFYSRENKFPLCIVKHNRGSLWSFECWLVWVFLWTNKWPGFWKESLLLSSSHWAWLDIFFICLGGPKIIRQEAISLFKTQKGDLPSEETNNLLNTTTFFFLQGHAKKSHYWFLLDWEGSLKNGF